MSIIFHGNFNLYTPAFDEGNPKTWLTGVLHSKNESGQDFYEIRDSIPETSLVVLVQPGANVVSAASRGPLMAFPTEGQGLYEIPDAPPSLTPDLSLGRQVDLVTGEVAPLIVLPVAQITAKADIFRRASDEQAEQMVALLAAQSVRNQEIFKAAQHINHADELFALLLGGLTSLFGETEANRLLAIS